VTLLDAAFHGRGDSGPEWPPSPLRAFQALRAAAAARAQGTEAADDLAAFAWLESLDPPEIVAPYGRITPEPYRLYVPNNHGDLLIKAWADGDSEATMAGEKHLTLKVVSPVRLDEGDALLGGTTIRYLWRLPAEPSAKEIAHVGRLADAARGVTHLGWGIDQAVGWAELLDEAAATVFPDESKVARWRPGGGTPLRVPQPASSAGPSTTEALDRRYAAFVRRMQGGVPRDVPPLAADQFRIVGYGRPTDPPGRPYAAFELRSLGSGAFRAFAAARCAKDVAGMVRHAVSNLALRMQPFGWAHDDVGAFVHGHASPGGDLGTRFSYLPLPSLEHRKSGWFVGPIRRVLIVAPPGHRNEVIWVRALAGQELVGLGISGPAAVLRLIDRPDEHLCSDMTLGPYIGEASVWSTVTPVLLPGFDDPDRLWRRMKDREFENDAARQRSLLKRLSERIDGLIRKAFRQSGLPGGLVDHAEVEWRKAGFRAGVERADRYKPPRNLEKWPRYHVRVRWCDANGNEIRIRGPIAVGAGRHRGLGVFAAEG
jgi:CRISPR-associated protein Csb2